MNQIAILGRSYKQRKNGFVVKAVDRKVMGGTTYVEMEHRNGVRYFQAEYCFRKELSPYLVEEPDSMKFQNLMSESISCAGLIQAWGL